jgi:hypothetical protein
MWVDIFHPRPAVQRDVRGLALETVEGLPWPEGYEAVGAVEVPDDAPLVYEAAWTTAQNFFRRWHPLEVVRSAGVGDVFWAEDQPPAAVLAIGFGRVAGPAHRRLLPAAGILCRLADEPTEGHLAEQVDPSTYFTWVMALGDCDHAQTTIVTCADGLLVLPVTLVTTGAGWEHFDLEAASTLETPPQDPLGINRNTFVWRPLATRTFASCVCIDC